MCRLEGLTGESARFGQSSHGDGKEVVFLVVTDFDCLNQRAMARRLSQQINTTRRKAPQAIPNPAILQAKEAKTKMHNAE